MDVFINFLVLPQKRFPVITTGNPNKTKTKHVRATFFHKPLDKLEIFLYLCRNFKIKIYE